MTYLYALLAAMGALAIYLAVPHQQLLARGVLLGSAAIQRLGAVLLCAVALIRAARTMGTWAAVCFTLIVLMTCWIALPVLDAALRRLGSRKNVG